MPFIYAWHMLLRVEECVPSYMRSSQGERPRLPRQLGAPGPAQTHESISCHCTTHRGIASRPYRYRPAGIACIGVRVNLALIDNLGLHRIAFKGD
jgi:hypothetical protein